ncbi:MAG: mechanosensitive ion channel [Burkholderiaceae bacterium]|nr:mechanosensitive ion channel [Burkholderiaceae bacterium]
MRTPFAGLLCCLTLSLACSAKVFAQVPVPLLNALSKSTQPATTAPSTATTSVDPTAQPTEKRLEAIATQQADIEKRYDAARANLVKNQNALKEIRDPTTAAYTAMADRISALQAQVDSYSEIIDGLKDLRRLIGKQDIAQKELDRWTPPTGNPPWPLSVADAVHLSLSQLQFQIEHLDQRLAIVDTEIVDERKRRAQLEVDLRQLSGRTEPVTNVLGAATGKSVESVRRQLELINLELISNSINREIVLTQRAATQAELSHRKKTVAYYDGRFEFSDAEFTKLMADIDARTVNLRKQEQQASVRINRTLDDASNAKARLDKLEQTPNTPPEAIASARRAWRTADAQASAARIEREKFGAMIELESLNAQLWKLRKDIYSNDAGSQELTPLKLKQQALARRLDTGLHYLTQMIGERSQMSNDLNDQLQSTKDPAEAAFLMSLIKPINEQLDNARTVYATIDRARSLLEIVGEELKAHEAHRDIKQTLQVVWKDASSILVNSWNYELFAVDDTIIVEGRELKTKRSITIGKSVGALLILVIGFMLITNLTRRTMAYAVTKGTLSASKSVIIGRWFSLITGITLIVTAFNLVEIPLSAFAFFGGALAIGVGFGTQNLLKNLISGVMLLIEKPVRIGDLVEIDGITGTVTMIGIRFSTIHGAQGTDTLIPNSVLVEQKLVNWTYSTPDVRKDVRVSVAYDSDVDKVSELLLNVTQAHKSVIRTPAPLITLEDFGNDGLVFNVQFWLQIQAGVSILRIMSDIRLSILKAFNEAGIEIPFPQRVLRFQGDQPAQVQITEYDSPSG